MEEVTSILTAIEQGDLHAAERLLPLVYEELRKLAGRQIARENPGLTIQATALVHEAYLRLVGEKDPGWHGRGHFVGAAAEAMRRILVEHARRKKGPRRGGGKKRMEIELDRMTGDLGLDRVDILALDEAITRLATVAPARAELVKLRFFTGLSVAESASVMGISVATAERYWTYARAWLLDELGESAKKVSPVEGSSPEFSQDKGGEPI